MCVQFSPDRTGTRFSYAFRGREGGREGRRGQESESEKNRKEGEREIWIMQAKAIPSRHNFKERVPHIYPRNTLLRFVIT